MMGVPIRMTSASSWLRRGPMSEGGGSVGPIWAAPAGPQPWEAQGDLASGLGWEGPGITLSQESGWCIVSSIGAEKPESFL